MNKKLLHVLLFVLLEYYSMGQSRVNKIDSVKSPSILKSFNTSGIVSSEYNYGLQQFNPKVKKPAGYFIYIGNANVSYKIVPLNLSFQYTNYKDFYGIPKYLHVDLDTRKLKENILAEISNEKDKITDSLNVTNKAKAKIGQKVNYLKHKLDSSKVSQVNKDIKVYEDSIDELNSKNYLINNRIEELYKDSLSNQLLNDSLSSTYNDSLNYYRNELQDNQVIIGKTAAQLNQNIYQKNIYDSLQNQLSAYEKKYNEYNTKSQELKKISEQHEKPDSAILLYINRSLKRKMPMPPNAIAALSYFAWGLKTLEFGMCNPNYSPFSINGTSLKGVNVEWGNGQFYGAVTYGKTLVNPLANLQRNSFNPLLAVRNPYNYFDFNNDTLTRKIFYAKLGIGSQEGSHLFIGFLNGNGSASIDMDTAIHHKFEKNGINEIDGCLKIGKNNFLSINYARSSLLRLQNIKDGPLLKTFEEIYKQQDNESGQILWNSYISKTSTSFFVSARIVKKYYESFGLSFLNSDNLRYEFQVNQQIGKRIKLSLNYRHFQDNLLWFFNERNIIQTAGIILQYKVNRRLTSTILISPAKIDQKTENKEQVNQNILKNNSLITTVLITYKSRKSELDINNNLYKFNYDTLKTIYYVSSISFKVKLKKNLQLQNEIMNFYTSKQDTTFKTCIILQSGLKIALKMLNINFILRSSYNNQHELNYGYDCKLQYPFLKSFLSEVSTSKYVGGNFLLGYDDSLLKMHPYMFSFKLSYKW